MRVRSKDLAKPLPRGPLRHLGPGGPLSLPWQSIRTGKQCAMQPPEQQGKDKKDVTKRMECEIESEEGPDEPDEPDEPSTSLPNLELSLSLSSALSQPIFVPGTPSPEVDPQVFSSVHFFPLMYLNNL